jgi:hypothetical protein
METGLNPGDLPCVPSSAPRPHNEEFVSHYPRLREGAQVAPGDPVACEQMLTEWFDSPVILLASGKSGLHLYLQAKGFHRYRHRLNIPPYLSRCFVNAFTPSVFPVHPPEPSDGVFLYHQYGFPQRCRPDSRVVIEDIAHLFFTSPASGAREWAGEVAIFSLPKFFAMGGIVGGLVSRNLELLGGIREMVAAAPPPPPSTRAWMRQIIANAYKREPTPLEIAFVSSAYELLLEFFDPDPVDLAGFPTSVTELGRVGDQRLERVRFYRKFFGHRAYAETFWSEEEQLLPFALPYFGRGDLASLERANQALEEEEGVRAGIYQFDLNRDMYRPRYQPCILLPCHQRIPMDAFDRMCRLIERHDS